MSCPGVINEAPTIQGQASGDSLLRHEITALRYAVMTKERGAAMSENDANTSKGGCAGCGFSLFAFVVAGTLIFGGCSGWGSSGNDDKSRSSEGMAQITCENYISSLTPGRVSFETQTSFVLDEGSGWERWSVSGNAMVGAQDTHYYCNVDWRQSDDSYKIHNGGFNN